MSNFLNLVKNEANKMKKKNQIRFYRLQIKIYLPMK